QIDPLLVRDDQQHEEHVRQLDRQVLLRLVRLLDLVAEPVVHLARQLAHFLDQAGQVRERWPVAFLEPGDPGIHPLLRLAELHQEGPGAGTSTTFPNALPPSRSSWARAASSSGRIPWISGFKAPSNTIRMTRRNSPGDPMVLPKTESCFQNTNLISVA